MKIINSSKYYTISEVAEIIGVTRCTILRWYEYESTKHIKLLPEYITVGKNNARHWNENDLDKFKLFAKETPKGSMAEVSNKYNGANKTIK